MSDEWAQARVYVGQQPTAFHTAASAEPSSLAVHRLDIPRSRNASDPVGTRLLGRVADERDEQQLELVSKLDAACKVREEPFHLG